MAIYFEYINSDLESYKKDYIKYLNKCSDGASINASDDGDLSLAIFTGINLNESCLYHEFKKHHKVHNAFHNNYSFEILFILIWIL